LSDVVFANPRCQQHLFDQKLAQRRHMRQLRPTLRANGGMSISRQFTAMVDVQSKVMLRAAALSPLRHPT
jgi:hypothetical protein